MEKETWTVPEINVVYEMMKNDIGYSTIAKTLNHQERRTRSLMELLETNPLLLQHLQTIDPTEQLSLPYLRELAKQLSRMENDGSRRSESESLSNNSYSTLGP